MLVRDVMTVGVITVAPDSSIRELAQLMVGAHVSGLPVIEDGRVVGIVSESDLLLAGRRDGGPLTADVMTEDPVTLTEDMTVTEAARLFQRHRIKRAPVVRAGRLVGIVTCMDLLRPFLRTDSEICAEVEDDVLRRSLSLSPRAIRVWASEGVVGLEGVVPGERVRVLLLQLVRAIDGVVDVVDRLAVEESSRDFVGRGSA